MKVIMTGGGTGGHIYPAIAIADKIKKEQPDAEILFVGTRKGLEKDLVPQNGYPIEFITVSGFYRKKLLKNVKTMRDLAKGNKEAKEILNRFRPDVVIGTGGYVCGPMVRAAAKRGIPTYIHEQNALPGITNRMLEKYVKKVFLAFADGASYFKQQDKLMVTGNPVRKNFFRADRETSRNALGIPEDSFVLMSFGGSQGAGKINDVMLASLAEFQKRKNMFVVFATGKYYYYSVCEEIKRQSLVTGDTVRVIEYIDNMPQYLAASDLVVSRAGALTISEITAIGRAAILVPSPNVTGNHQYYNAKSVSDAGGAILIEDGDFTEEYLKKQVFELMADRKKLAALEYSSKNAAQGDAADLIYREIAKEVFQ